MVSFKGWFDFRRLILMPMILCAVVASGCAKPGYDGFKVPRDTLRTTVGTVAMWPPFAPYSVMDPIDTGVVFEPPATARLEAAGLRVVPSSTYKALWDRAASDVGGIYDPSTGEADDERFDMVRDAVYRELAREHDVDAVVYLSVGLIGLERIGSRPIFCGYRGAVNFPPRLRSPNVGLEVLYASAACLNVSVYDMNQQHLYGIREGLAIVETYARQTRATEPFGRKLKDPQRITDAIERTLGPFADGMAGED